MSETDDLFERWLTALRSGDYQQGRNHLRRFDNYCCLGVLCDVFNPNLWELHDPTTIYRYKYGAGAADDLLPPRDLLDAVFGEDAPGELISFLARINDNGATFEKIADFIEWALVTHQQEGEAFLAELADRDTSTLRPTPFDVHLLRRYEHEDLASLLEQRGYRGSSDS